VTTPEQTLPEMRRGWLKNGNPPGDFAKAPRCGAKTRCGRPCQAPAMANGRCRLHGGLSTGPKTLEGIERIRRAVTKHGRYSAASQIERQQYRALLRDGHELIHQIRNAQVAGNGISSGPGRRADQRQSKGSTIFPNAVESTGERLDGRIAVARSKAVRPTSTQVPIREMEPAG